MYESFHFGELPSKSSWSPDGFLSSSIIFSGEIRSSAFAYQTEHGRRLSSCVLEFDRRFLNHQKWFCHYPSLIVAVFGRRDLDLQTGFRQPLELYVAESVQHSLGVQRPVGAGTVHWQLDLASFPGRSLSSRVLALRRLHLSVSNSLLPILCGDLLLRHALKNALKKCCRYGEGDSYILKTFHTLLYDCNCLYLGVHQYLAFPRSSSIVSLYYSLRNFHCRSLQNFPGLLSGGALRLCALELCALNRMDLNLSISRRLDRILRHRMRQWCCLLTFLFILKSYTLTKNSTKGVPALVDFFSKLNSSNIADSAAAVAFFRNCYLSFLCYSCDGYQDALVVRRSSLFCASAILRVG